jgi:hypothetical protein
MSHSPAFSIAAPLLKMTPTLEVIVAVEPEGFSRIRPPLRLTLFVLIVRPPLVLVRPAPVIVPPVKVVGPLTVTWSVPPSVPLFERERLAEGTVAPVLRFSVPLPEMERLPEVAEAPGLRFSVPPLTAVAPAGE